MKKPDFDPIKLSFAGAELIIDGLKVNPRRFGSTTAREAATIDLRQMAKRARRPLSIRMDVSSGLSYATYQQASPHWHLKET
ncbi:MAG: hypothetical protein EOO81_01050 [Oxalobacteraceae bacterium]|nr:MAG: hypothetical protein EOO81_01050 [Oxalobacteraceae bacterium]